jgi:hypothetical protein
MLPACRGEATELEINLTRCSVHEGPERHDSAAAHPVDQPLDETAVKAADEVRTDLGQLAERAMSKCDRRPVTVVGDCRVKADGGQLGGQRIETRCSLRPRFGVSTTLVAAGLRRLVRAGTRGSRDAEQQAGEERKGRRFESERGCSRRNRVQMLGPTDAAPGVRTNLEQTDLAHALEMRPDRVRMQVEGVGDLSRGQRKR